MNSVIRLQRDVLESSNIGLLVVDGTSDNDYNRVISTDASFAMSGGYRLDAQIVGSQAKANDFESAAYVRFSRQTQLYNYRVAYTGIDPGFRENFNPIGFIQDDNRRQLEMGGGKEIWITKHGITKLNTNAHGNIFWSYSGKLRNLEAGSWIGITFLEKWMLGYAYNYHIERFEKRFNNHNGLWEAGYNQQAWNNVGLLHQWGKNFDADFQRLRFRVNLKPNNKLATSYEYTYFSLSPDPDHRSTKIHFLTTDYNFTPDIWLRLITQYSKRSERFYSYCLFGWRFSPPFGSLYIAYTADDFDQEDEIQALINRERQRTFFIKLTVPMEFQR